MSTTDNYNKLSEQKSDIIVKISSEVIQTLDIENNIKQCYICLMDDNHDDLIIACKCRGTAEYIHKKCLWKWLCETDNPESKKKCTICKYEYQFVDTHIQGKCLINIIDRDLFIGIFIFINIFAHVAVLSLYSGNVLLQENSTITLYIAGSGEFLLWIFLLFIHYCLLNNKRLFRPGFTQILIKKYYKINNIIFLFFIIFSFISVISVISSISSMLFISFVFFITIIFILDSIIIKSFYEMLNKINIENGRDILPYVGT